MELQVYGKLEYSVKSGLQYSVVYIVNKPHFLCTVMQMGDLQYLMVNPVYVIEEF